MNTERILSGYFDDFLGGKTLLLLGSALAFLKLANRLKAIDPAEQLDAQELGILPGKVGFELSLTIYGESGSAISRPIDSSALVWTMGTSTVKAIALQLRTLAENKEPAHAYLETEGEIQIIASVDEYPASVLRD